MRNTHVYTLGFVSLLVCIPVATKATSICEKYTGLARNICEQKVKLNTLRSAQQGPCANVYGLEKAECERKAQGSTDLGRQVLLNCRGLTGHNRRNCVAALSLNSNIIPVDSRRSVHGISKTDGEQCNRFQRASREYRACTRKRYTDSRSRVSAVEKRYPSMKQTRADRLSKFPRSNTLQFGTCRDDSGVRRLQRQCYKDVQTEAYKVRDQARADRRAAAKLLSERYYPTTVSE